MRRIAMVRGAVLVGRAGVWACACTALVGLGCDFDRAHRWDTESLAGQRDSGAADTALASECEVGQMRCSTVLQRCALDSSGVAHWTVQQDCAAQGKVCAASLQACTHCVPHSTMCDGARVLRCASDGAQWHESRVCPQELGQACRFGRCVDLCGEAAMNKSNVGCEYWGVDLDNANIDATSNAAAQQYAIVVSNPQPDLPARVIVEQDDGAVGGESALKVVGDATVFPSNLHVFKLGPREVDGSPPGQYNTGSGTAITRAAFRVTSSVPVVAYQFNPLDNVSVFSNDASLLKPVEAVEYSSNTLALHYLALGWPQTIAHTNDPDTNFNPNKPTNLRATLTVVVARDQTRVKVMTAADVIPGSGIPRTSAGSSVTVVLNAFEVLNLETGGFNADFTGSQVWANGPVLVFTGSEASDAPYFRKLSERYCCADHLEEQLDPLRTAGKRFFVPHAPNRTQALRRAGAKSLAVVEEPQYVRVMSVAKAPVQVQTSLGAPDDALTLPGRGAYIDLVVTRDFMLEASGPVMVAMVQASQEAAGIRRGLPGGDPSMIVLPPIEQYREDYAFLTPDKYAFDFVTIVAAADTEVRLDGADMTQHGCERAPADGLDARERQSEEPPAWVYRCQLSFPRVLPDKEAPNNVQLGEQNDGVHRIVASAPVLALVYGFDNYVSYGYAAGTQLAELVVR